MVHHSIAVVITSFLPNFLERRKVEVRLSPVLVAQDRVGLARCSLPELPFPLGNGRFFVAALMQHP